MGSPGNSTATNHNPFRTLAENRHHYAREWKARTGRPVFGYFCTYVPEEIIYAAGILPVRILGSHQPQDVTEPYIFGIYCPFCRDCLAQGLLGRYDYLDGLVKARSCMHIRQTFTSWVLHIPVGYSYYISMPSLLQAPSALPFLVKELTSFRDSLREWTGRAIPDSALREAIEVYNTNRRLLRELYELRKAPSPPLSGAEAMELTLSGQLSDKAEHNRLLSQLLKELPGRRPSPDGAIRLMVLGSEDDDTEFLRLIESLGAAVVIDDHCTGSRYFWNQTPPSPDPLTALAVRYLERPPCPAKDLPGRRRWPHILSLIQDYGVQGVVILQQKFCEPHEYDIPPLVSLLQEKGIPSLVLEYDLAVAVAQFRTRLEAFLEMLQLEM